MPALVSSCTYFSWIWLGRAIRWALTQVSRYCRAVLKLWQFSRMPLWNSLLKMPIQLRSSTTSMMFSTISFSSRNCGDIRLYSRSRCLFLVDNKDLIYEFGWFCEKSSFIHTFTFPPGFIPIILGVMCTGPVRGYRCSYPFSDYRRTQRDSGKDNWGRSLRVKGMLQVTTPIWLLLAQIPVPPLLPSRPSFLETFSRTSALQVLTMGQSPIFLISQILSSSWGSYRESSLYRLVQPSWWVRVLRTRLKFQRWSRVYHYYRYDCFCFWLLCCCPILSFGWGFFIIFELDKIYFNNSHLAHQQHFFVVLFADFPELNSNWAFFFLISSMTVWA